MTNNQSKRFLLAALLAAGTLSHAQALDFSVNTSIDSTDAAPGDGLCADGKGACSLRAAVQEANASGGVNNIVLATGLYKLTIAGAGEQLAASGDLDVTASIFVQGNNAVIDANGIDRAFDVLAPGSLAIEAARIINGAPPVSESGGAIRSDSQLSLTRVAMSGNTVSGSGASGGAIFNNGGVADLAFCSMSDNVAVRAGGAIEANAGITRIEESTMTANFAGPMPGNGGGLHLTGAGEVTVIGGAVNSNVASSEGGGLWNSAAGLFLVDRVVFNGNRASGDAADNGGGALFNDGGEMTVTASTISRNVANGLSGSGGGIFNNDGILSVAETALLSNGAARAGGGIESLLGTTTLTDVDLVGNSARTNPGNGGGLHVSGAGDVDVFGGTVKDNFARAEGGGLWNGSGLMRVRDVNVSGNIARGTQADQGGGGLFNAGGTLEVSFSTIESNLAIAGSGSGGGIFNDQGTLVVENSELAGNTSQRAGGGIEAKAGITSLNGVLLYDNDTGAAPGNGGGLHLTGEGEVTVADSGVFRNNAANEGGGLWNSAVGTMIVTDTGISENTSPVGADVFNDGGTFTVDGVPVPPGP